MAAAAAVAVVVVAAAACSSWILVAYFALYAELREVQTRLALHDLQ